MESENTSFQIDFWPGFVDVLASLLIVMIFALIIFIMSQFSLSHELAGSTQFAQSLEGKVAELTNLLNVKHSENANLKQQASEIQLNAEQNIAVLRSEIEALNQHLQMLNAGLESSKVDVEQKQLKLDELNTQLASVLAQQVHQLEKYRSEFFGKLQDVMGNRADVKIVGDRFVFQSEVLFPTASANLSDKGKIQLKQLATTMKEITAKIPPETSWILRVDGHTDSRPIHTKAYASNWELSTARAIAVVRYLILQGIAPQNLTAAGFGENHPLEAGDTEEARAKNRRIELKFDQR